MKVYLIQNMKTGAIYGCFKNKNKAYKYINNDTNTYFLRKINVII